MNTIKIDKICKLLTLELKGVKYATFERGYTSGLCPGLNRNIVHSLTEMISITKFNCKSESGKMTDITECLASVLHHKEFAGDIKEMASLGYIDYSGALYKILGEMTGPPTLLSALKEMSIFYFIVYYYIIELRESGVTSLPMSPATDMMLSVLKYIIIDTGFHQKVEPLYNRIKSLSSNYRYYFFEQIVQFGLRFATANETAHNRNDACLVPLSALVSYNVYKSRKNDFERHKHCTLMMMAGLWSLKDVRKGYMELHRDTPLSTPYLVPVPEEEDDDDDMFATPEMRRNINELIGANFAQSIATLGYSHFFKAFNPYYDPTETINTFCKQSDNVRERGTRL